MSRRGTNLAARCLLAFLTLFASRSAIAFDSVEIVGAPYGVLKYQIIDLSNPDRDIRTVEGPSPSEEFVYIKKLFARLASQDGPVKDKIGEIQAARGCGRLSQPAPENTVLLEWSGWRYVFRHRYRTFLNWESGCGSMADSRPVLGLDWEILRGEDQPNVVTIMLFGMGDLSNDPLPEIRGIARPYRGCVSECG